MDMYRYIQLANCVSTLNCDDQSNDNFKCNLSILDKYDLNNILLYILDSLYKRNNLSTVYELIS